VETVYIKLVQFLAEMVDLEKYLFIYDKGII